MLPQKKPSLKEKDSTSLIPNQNKQLLTLSAVRAKASMTNFLFFGNVLGGDKSTRPN